MKFNAKETFKSLIETVEKKWNEVEKIITEKVKGTIFEETSFSFHHFKTVLVISFVAFFMVFSSTGFNTTRVDAGNFDVSQHAYYNGEAMEVSFGDSAPIVNLAKDILSNQVSKVINPKAISVSAYNSVYQIGDYMATIQMNITPEESYAMLNIESKYTYSKNTDKKVVSPTTKDDLKILDGISYQFKIRLHVVDTEAPKINVITNEINVMESDSFRLEDYIVSVVDNMDGVMTNYTIENNVPVNENGCVPAGTYSATIKAKDTNGNEAVQPLVIKSHRKTAANKYVTYNLGKATYASNGAIGTTIANAALAQLGRYQDCTMLVTNSLRSVGVYFHGWPYEYLSLGTIVPYSQAMPGDVVVYNGHVAVYIGNGQCVHGGWYGVQTVVYSIYCSSGAFTIVRI